MPFTRKRVVLLGGGSLQSREGGSQGKRVAVMVGREWWSRSPPQTACLRTAPTTNTTCVGRQRALHQWRTTREGSRGELYTPARRTARAQAGELHLVLFQTTRREAALPQLALWCGGRCGHRRRCLGTLVAGREGRYSIHPPWIQCGGWIVVGDLEGSQAEP